MFFNPSINEAKYILVPLFGGTNVTSPIESYHVLTVVAITSVKTVLHTCSCPSSLFFISTYIRHVSSVSLLPKDLINALL